MSIIEKVIDRAIGKNWIPQRDKSAVLKRIQELGLKYGFTPDDFGIALCTESEGGNPGIKNSQGCVGIVQFCRDRIPGVKEIGNKTYKLSSIRKMSFLQQLELTDDYYSRIISESAKKNMPGVRLYLYILHPVAARNFDEIDPNANLKTHPAIHPYGGLFNNQSTAFYVNKVKNGTITINSIKAGLEEKAAALLGEPITSSPAETGGSFSSSEGTRAASEFGLITASINGKCNDIFPVKFGIKEALTYKGCLNKISASVMGGNSLAYPSQGMRVNGASNVSLADYDPSVPVTPGSLGKPMSSSRMILTSPWGKVRTRRSGGLYWHSGQDYGATGGSLGLEVIAVADGVVINNKLVSGYTPGTVEIVSPPELGNLFIRYGHITPSVQIGQQVKKGDVIGKIAPYPQGGPHLHLELRKDKGKGGSAYSEQQLRAETLNPALYCKRK